ncbi:pentatricopeptide repeat-containing protein At5g57250, mitochondrial [Silene latifolia]|uniref:pentatricopeptide repeat-containing protein At5g57250, mitochondrial n=1 Tax=Silene latifolia TaxID=37657 RepID=UPI003D789DFC
MAKRAGQCYYKILRSFMLDSGHGKIHPIFTTFIKKYGLRKPTLGTMLVRHLCLESNVDVALRLIHELDQNNLKLHFPADVIRTLKDQGRLVDAYKLVVGAQIDDIDVVDYSILVHRLSKEGYIDKALELCNLAIKRGVFLNVVTYNSLFNGLCRQGCLVEAFRLFDALEQNNIFPSEITFGTLIDALVREGYLLDAKQLFERMVVKNIKPNTHIYNSLIDGYCKFGNVKEALRLFGDLENKSLQPDRFTISSLIYGFFLKGNMEEALVFFMNMKENGFSPDFLGFLYLVRGMCSKGRMEEARSVLREMLQDQSVIELINRVDEEIETESVEGFLVNLCEQGNIQAALVILNEIGSMFFPYKRNTSPEEENLTIPSEGDNQDVSVNFLSTIHQMDFDTIYSRMATLCSEGNVQGAADVAKAMIRDCAND